jgi:O-antigen/teichoic acid export membrane protein
LGAPVSTARLGERIVIHNLLVSAGTLTAGLLGFAFQIVVSHTVAPAEYGAIFAVMTLVTLVGLPAGALTLLMAREASRDRATGQHASSAAMLHDGNRLLLLTGLVFAAAAVATSPWFGHFLNIPISLLLAGALGIPFALASPLLIGDLQGEQRFIAFTSLAVGQAAIKLVGAVVLGITFGAPGVILGVSTGGALSYLAAYRLLRRKLAIKARWPWHGPALAYLSILLPSTLALAILLSADVLLVKHFFPQRTAGEYAAVVALSRALFYAAAGVAAVLFPKVISRESQGISGSSIVWLSVALVTVGGMAGLATLTVASSPLLTAFAGTAYVGGAAYLPLYAVGMILLGTAAVLIATHQSRSRRDFLAVLIPLALIEPAGILVFHQNLFQVVEVVDACMLALAVGLGALYVVRRGAPVTFVATRPDVILQPERVDLRP